MIVLDASVLIALFNESDGHHRWARQFLIDTAEEEWCISALNFAEVLVSPARSGQLEGLHGNVDGLGLDVRGVEPGHVTAIAELRAKSSLKMPDAIALHLALTHGAALATTDSRLVTEANSRGCAVYHPDQKGDGESARGRTSK